MTLNLYVIPRETNAHPLRDAHKYVQNNTNHKKKRERKRERTLKNNRKTTINSKMDV